jgi:hypothetical protein
VAVSLSSFQTYGVLPQYRCAVPVEPLPVCTRTVVPAAMVVAGTVQTCSAASWSVQPVIVCVFCVVLLRSAYSASRPVFAPLSLPGCRRRSSRSAAPGAG